jgi:hypothetical protein
MPQPNQAKKPNQLEEQWPRTTQDEVIQALGKYAVAQGEHTLL